MIATSTISPALKIGLQCLGVWPNVPYSTVYWFLVMLSTLIVQYFQYLYVFSHFKLSELSNLVDGLSSTLESSLMFIKVASLWKHRRILHQLLAAMDNDWRECNDVHQHLNIMTIKAGISHFCSNAMFSFNTFASVLYLLGDYVIRFVYLTKDYNNSLRQFPVKAQFPFETEQSPIFELLVLGLFLHVMSDSFTIAIVNGLIFSLVFHMSGQIDIICQSFRTISKSIHDRSSISTLGTLIERHNRVVLFSEQIGKLFSFITLMQIAANTLVICCIGFLITISIHNESGFFVLLKAILAYVAIMIEAFIICFAGEYLSVKSKCISDAAYKSLWYDLPPREGKAISFMILRSQKRLVITAGKITNLSLETFAKIIKASASYVSVLHAMY
ncbi:odorant receptor 4-like isoform X1 [Camponotus floridanus]|uniref:odorant receptor 4-like isoform X1 n=1 Tax=Camponotus floridanus TaxID=104421 RepID=UPI00059C36AA|nr:odorant receptor 4-like isoform X1 [Camponotus floridanus]